MTFYTRSDDIPWSRQVVSYLGSYKHVGKYKDNCRCHYDSDGRSDVAKLTDIENLPPFCAQENISVALTEGGAPGSVDDWVQSRTHVHQPVSLPD